MAREIPSEIQVNKIKIKKPEGQIFGIVGGGDNLDILPLPEDSGDELFINLNLTESIFQTGISGQLKIKEPGLVGDYFNLIGNETVEISMKSPEPIDEEVNLTLCINNVKYLGDETEDALSGPSARSGAGWALELVSCESYFLDSGTLDYMDSDYVGSIGEFVETLA